MEASAWLDGRLHVGDTLARKYDDGLVTVRFQVGPRQDAVPIRWVAGTSRRPARRVR